MQKFAVDIVRYNKAFFPNILALYTDAGWTNYTQNPDMLEKAYQNSLCILCARCDGTIAGVVRAVGDGFSIVYIQDLLVHSAYRRHGIGGVLLETVLSEYPDVYQTILLTDKTDLLVRFYKNHGFLPVETCGCISFCRLRPPR